MLNEFGAFEIIFVSRVLSHWLCIGERAYPAISVHRGTIGLNIMQKYRPMAVMLPVCEALDTVS